MKELFWACLIIIVGTVIGWAATVGIVYLLTLCFGLPFSLPVATGIWIVFMVVKGLFSKGKGD